MRAPSILTALALAISLAAVDVRAQSDEAEDYGCIVCHGEAELWEGEDQRYHVTAEALSADIHWESGLRCHDCHGGDPGEVDYGAAHAEEAGFRKIESPKDIPGFCGHCHSSIEYMRRFDPSPRVDQAEEYWTSGHGKRLKESGDPKVATCVSCHGGRHGTRAVNDLNSSVYPTRVAETCATCHADAEKMSGYTYHDRPLGSDQYAKWKESVHGVALVKKGDLSAPTCNDCHGNHGALPPEIGSVVNACGSCHGKVASLFAQTRMKHRFEEVGLPGCATCHNYHDIEKPTDAMVGMGPDSTCARCHSEGRHGATTVGAEGSRAMRENLERLKAGIADAEARLASAERLGMEVQRPKFELAQARSALTNARTLVHTMSLEKFMEPISKGLEVAGRVKASADEAHEEHGARRRWLVGSLVLIAAAIAVLIVVIRKLPLPQEGASN
jgi:hypothetical protein